AAGLCMALITHWDKRVLGSGAEQFVRAVSERNTDFSLTTAFSKLAATVATLGFGASGGTEGLR
ncbi:MAG: hypothetical protein GX316_11015, partial [Firmicutes bacterium]|nr:hypothetical protein [Bacillota bacterium]